jgi:hypothetical protein
MEPLRSIKGAHLLSYLAKSSAPIRIADHEEAPRGGPPPRRPVLPLSRSDHLASAREAVTAGEHGNSSSSAAHDEESAGLPTKVSNRPGTTNTHATHRPEKLKEFFLPEVEINGLPLKAALAKLRTAYDDVCRESGEVPIRLTVVVPPEATRSLTVKTGIRNLDASIRLLAAMSGLKVSRSGSEYTFTAPEETGEVVKKTFRISPDFFSRASGTDAAPFAEGAPPAKMSPAEYFASNGLLLGPSTKFTPSVMSLQVESTSAADQIAIEGLIDLALNETPLQHKMQTKVIQIPAGIDWTPPDLSQLDDAGEQQLMRTLAQTRGVDLLTTPAITARVDEDAKVESIREVILPSKTPDGEYTTDHVGVVVGLRPVPYGLGHRVDLNFSEKVIVEGPESDPIKIVERTSISDSSYSGDGNARMHIQTHPDGSRFVLLVTPTLVDATGRPIHGKE